jgi:uncharacterized protein YjbI with pentapeptide repeats
MKTKLNILLKIIDYAKTKSTNNSNNNPNIGNLVTILYLVSNFGSFNFDKKVNYIDLDHELYNFSNCNLSYAILSNAVLENINLSGANLTGVKLQNANLFNANLTGANLKNADLSGSNLKESKLNNAELDSTDLQRTNLQNSKFIGAKLYYTNFQNSDLRYSDFDSAFMLDTNLSHTDLRDANLCNININLDKNLYAEYDTVCDIDLSLSILAGTKLLNAEIPYAIIVNPASYEKLFLNEKTNLKNAIIDEKELISYIERFSKNVPSSIKNKKELRERLKNRDEYPNDKWYLSISKLPLE